MPVMDTTAIRKAVTLAGGQTALARRLGVSQGLVWQWCEGLLKVTAERCASVESATAGEVTRLMLRPDVFGAPPATDAQAVGARTDLHDPTMAASTVDGDLREAG